MADVRFVTKGNMESIVTALKNALSNQNAFGKVTVDDVDIEAGAEVDQIELVAGANVTITADAAEGTVTISATDTTYGAATASVSGVGGTDGLLTASDKEKLDGVATGAQVNQNAYANVKYGETTMAAASKQDTFEVAAGTNVTITADATNKKVTIAATDTTYADVVADSTGAADSGLMTSEDKYKLDNVAAGAQVNVLETVKVNDTALTATGKAVNVTIATGDSGVGTFKVNGTNVTPYGLGTAAAATVETTGVSSDTTTLATTAQVKYYVDTHVSSAYKASGSIAPAGVTSTLLVAGNEGNVYNLSAALTLDATSAALFVDGSAGESFPEGTNIAVVKVGNDYKFDVMAGFVDLSGYVLSSNLGGLTEDEVEEITDLL